MLFVRKKEGEIDWMVLENRFSINLYKGINFYVILLMFGLRHLATIIVSLVSLKIRSNFLRIFIRSMRKLHKS